MVTARYSYDAFGKRRHADGRYDAFGELVVDWVSDLNHGGDRGFTDHEHLDDIGLVHMNGRLYDPLIGRFLQADPFVQDPQDMRSYNRYAYCFNGPMNCTDPSGQIFKWLAHKWRDEIWRTTIGRAIVSIFVGALIGPGGGAELLFGVAKDGLAAAAIGGFAAGAVATGDLKGALQGAFSAGVFHGVGTFIAAEKITQTAARVALHGVAGCVTSVAGGGKCGPGALAGGFAKFGTGVLPLAGKIANAIKAAVLGGIGSKLGGGKFENGAVTGAFGYLFNELAHSTSCEQRGYNCFSLSAEGRQAIQRYEGFSLTVYDDGVGIPTVGWGHRVVAADGLAMGDTITMDQAQALFDRDVGGFVGAANRLIPLGSTQGQFDAAVSLMYNIGEGAFARSSLLQAWRAGDFGAMNIQWMSWNRAGGRVMNGLTIRRADELKMFYPYQDRFRGGG